MNYKSVGSVAALTVGGLFLRLYRPGQQSLWFDEAYSIFVTKLELAFSFELLVSDGVHPPLYDLNQRIALPLGESEAAVRILAMVFGVLTVPLMYTLEASGPGNELHEFRLRLRVNLPTTSGIHRKRACIRRSHSLRCYV